MIRTHTLLLTQRHIRRLKRTYQYACDYQYNDTTRVHTTSYNKTIADDKATTMTEHDGNANNETHTKNNTNNTTKAKHIDTTDMKSINATDTMNDININTKES